MRELKSLEIEYVSGGIPAPEDVFGGAIGGGIAGFLGGVARGAAIGAGRGVLGSIGGIIFGAAIGAGIAVIRGSVSGGGSSDFATRIRRR